MKKLNKEITEALPVPPKGNRLTFFAGSMVQGLAAPKGFAVRVTAAGVRSYVLSYRAKGAERRFTLGLCSGRTVIEAVRDAREWRRRIDNGADPLDEKAAADAAKEAAEKEAAGVKTVAAVIEDYLDSHARAKLRGVEHLESALRRLALPCIGEMPIDQLSRGDIAKMLDRIEKKSGPVAADRTRAYVRAAVAWQSERDETINLTRIFPKVRPRASGAERARARVLSDDELRVIWPVLGQSGVFGQLLRGLQLSAARRNELAAMRWDEIDGDIWTLPGSRNKTRRDLPRPLSRVMLDLIGEQPRTSEFVFPSPRGTAFKSYGRAKRALDAAVTAANGGRPLAAWRLHDLRRTARTLLARAKVQPHIAERALGHVVGRIEDIYNRHSHLDEMRDAFERLAAELRRIVEPAPDNVTQLRPAAAQAQAAQ